MSAKATIDTPMSTRSDWGRRLPRFRLLIGSASGSLLGHPGVGEVPPAGLERLEVLDVAAHPGQCRREHDRHPGSVLHRLRLHLLPQRRLLRLLRRLVSLLDEPLDDGVLVLGEETLVTRRPAQPG